MSGNPTKKPPRRVAIFQERDSKDPRNPFYLLCERESKSVKNAEQTNKPATKYKPPA